MSQIKTTGNDAGAFYCPFARVLNAFVVIYELRRGLGLQIGIVSKMDEGHLVGGVQEEERERV